MQIRQEEPEIIHFQKPNADLSSQLDSTLDPLRNIDLVRDQVASLQHDCSVLLAANQQLKEQLEHSDKQLQNVLSSKSWKVTAPIRNFKQASANLLKYVKDKLVCADSMTEFVTLKNLQKIYINPADQRAQHLINTQGDANPNSLLIWKELTNQDSWTHIVDIGANYGEMLLNVEFSPKSKVIALEPNPYVFRYLKKSLKKAGRHCRLLPVALAESDTNIRLEIDHTWSGLSGISGITRETEGHELEQVDVDAISLETLFKKYISAKKAKVLIKIDIEGSEIPVLKKSLEYLRTYSKIIILLEVVHCQQKELEWLFDNFDIFALSLEVNQLAKVNYLENYSSGVISGKYFAQDVVAVIKS